jgi:hypothetical protein
LLGFSQLFLKQRERQYMILADNLSPSSNAKTPNAKKVICEPFEFGWGSMGAFKYSKSDAASRS